MDKRSCGRLAGSTLLVGVFDFPILKFEEGKFATKVAFCYNAGVHPRINVHVDDRLKHFRNNR